MTSLESITRRGFLRGMSMTAAYLISRQLPGLAESASDTETFRRIIPFNQQSEPKIFLTKERMPHKLTKDEKYVFNYYLGEHAPQVKMPTVVESYKIPYFRPEKDASYAEKIISHSRASIAHLFAFLNAHGVNLNDDKEIFFEIPKTEHDVTFDLQDKTLFYIVSDFGSVINVVFNYSSGGRFLKDSLELENINVSGETGFELSISHESGKTLANMSYLPIFYKVSGELIHIIETPPIEALHRAMNIYTANHIVNHVDRLLKSQPAQRIDSLDFNLIKERYLPLEEKFVHAVSMPWLREYLKGSKYGITDEILRSRFDDYEKRLLYKGSNKLRDFIGNIGIAPAFDLYIKNPDVLFKVLEN